MSIGGSLQLIEIARLDAHAAEDSILFANQVLRRVKLSDWEMRTVSAALRMETIKYGTHLDQHRVLEFGRSLWTKVSETLYMF